MTTDTPTRAVIWIAVSSPEQAKDDKISLQEQERLARQECERRGWVVSGLLSVPGHSRSDPNLPRMLVNYRKLGISAYDDLEDMWDKHAFDVLVALNYSRLGRSGAAISHVIENTIASGASIYLIQDGMVKNDDFRFHVAMGGMKAGGEIDALKKRYEMGMKGRIARGLPASTPVMSHLLVRDPKTGKPVQDAPLRVDESQRPLFMDIATLLLEGVPWRSLELELYERFGHVDPATGQRYSGIKFYKVLYNPWFWGHAARNHATLREDAGRFGAWVYDPGVSPPPGVVIYRNTHEPMYTGELAVQVQAEMRRREDLRGHMSPFNGYAFSGLLICDECRHTLSGETQPVGKGGRRTPYTRWRCRTNAHVTVTPTRAPCSQKGSISDKVVREYVDRLLAHVLTSEDLLSVFPGDNAQTGQAQLEALSLKIKGQEAELDSIALELVRATTPTIQDLFRKKLNEVAGVLDKLRARYAQMSQAQIASEAVARQQQQAIDTLRGVTLDDFWCWPPRSINQLLRQLLGPYRIFVRDRRIVRLAHRVRM